MEQIENKRCFGGEQRRYKHYSDTNSCEMVFSIYLPPIAKHRRVPVVYWLSGLTCTDQNFVTKAGAQAAAAELGVAIVAPDTSPRGEGVPDAPDGAYDLGLAAGFYVNATQEPWQKHYQMYGYVVHELPALVEQHFSVTSQKSIAGHSMGGHGALTIALNNPAAYQSVSAFAPIANPTQCPWGQKAFSAYLGEDETSWVRHDAVELLSAYVGERLPMLIDVGGEDDFLAEQLGFSALVGVSETSALQPTIRLQSGYDHSYFFIASFIREHLEFHAKELAL